MSVTYGFLDLFFLSSLNSVPFLLSLNQIQFCSIFLLFTSCMFHLRPMIFFPSCFFWFEFCTSFFYSRGWLMLITYGISFCRPSGNFMAGVDMLNYFSWISVWHVCVELSHSFYADSFSKPVSGSDEPQQGGWFQTFTIAAYKPYFDVDTSDVLERIIDSLFPFRGSFNEKTATNPDLWVTLSFAHFIDWGYYQHLVLISYIFKLWNACL